MCACACAGFFLSENPSEESLRKKKQEINFRQLLWIPLSVLQHMWMWVCGTFRQKEEHIFELKRANVSFSLIKFYDCWDDLLPLQDRTVNPRFLLILYLSIHFPQEFLFLLEDIPSHTNRLAHSLTRVLARTHQNAHGNNKITEVVYSTKKKCMFPLLW